MLQRQPHKHISTCGSHSNTLTLASAWVIQKEYNARRAHRRTNNETESRLRVDGWLRQKSHGIGCERVRECAVAADFRDQSEWAHLQRSWWHSHSPKTHSWVPCHVIRIYIFWRCFQHHVISRHHHSTATISYIRNTNTQPHARCRYFNVILPLTAEVFPSSCLFFLFSPFHSFFIWFTENFDSNCIVTFYIYIMIWGCGVMHVIYRILKCNY